MRRKKKNTLPLLLLMLMAALFTLMAATVWMANRRTDPPSASSDPPSAPAVPIPPVCPASDEPVPASASAPPSSSLPDSERWRLILVNPTHPIPNDFTVKLAKTRSGYEVDQRIVEPLERMIDAAAAEGVTLLPCYGYRTKEQSQQLFDKQINAQIARGLSRDQAVVEAAKWVAPPGYSEHHTGLALDIVTPSNQVLSAAFAQTDAAVWMAENGHRFGFILRYPADKVARTGIVYEPWHMRYVGIEDATAIFERKLCLEEYLDAT